MKNVVYPDLVLLLLKSYYIFYSDLVDIYQHDSIIVIYQFRTSTETDRLYCFFWVKCSTDDSCEIDTPLKMNNVV